MIQRASARELSFDRAMMPHLPVWNVIVRTIVTIVGSTAIGIGGFMEWFRPSAMAGTDLGWRVFYAPASLSQTVDIFRSAGGVMVLIGILGLLGLSLRSGWITRIAGALALIGSGLFIATLFRAHVAMMSAIGAGLWVIIGGSIVTLIGGFLTTPVATAVPTPATASVKTLERPAGMLATEHECHILRNAVGGWEVIGPGRERDVATYEARHDAEMRARDLLVEDGGGELILHGRHGKVRGRRTVTAA